MASLNKRIETLTEQGAALPTKDPLTEALPPAKVRLKSCLGNLPVGPPFPGEVFTSNFAYLYVLEKLMEELYSFRQ